MFGEMDADGFYFAEVNGRHGLVPSNFLQEVPPGHYEQYDARVAQHSRDRTAAHGAAQQPHGAAQHRHGAPHQSRERPDGGRYDNPRSSPHQAPRGGGRGSHQGRGGVPPPGGRGYPPQPSHQHPAHHDPRGHVPPQGQRPRSREFSQLMTQQHPPPPHVTRVSGDGRGAAMTSHERLCSPQPAPPRSASRERLRDHRPSSASRERTPEQSLQPAADVKPPPPHSSSSPSAVTSEQVRAYAERPSAARPGARRRQP